jgi:hypothetical protein
MRRSLLLLGTVMFVLCCAFTSNAQIPNAGFESWSTPSGGVLTPDNWWANNIAGLWVPVTRSSTAHGGSYSVRGEAITVVTGGVYTAQVGGGSDLTGFRISNGRPASITGWYQFNPVQGDRLILSAGLSKGGSSGTAVAIGTQYVSNASSSWTQFTLPFVYLTSDVPDWGTFTLLITSASSSSVIHAGSYFLLDDMAYSGTASAVSGGNSAPTTFELSQNYPNPFNPSTKISFTLAQSGFVVLRIYNLLGTEVASILNQQMNPGPFSVQWNASGLPSGMYLYRLSVTSEKGILFDQTKKLTLLK